MLAVQPYSQSERDVREHEASLAQRETELTAAMAALPTAADDDAAMTRRLALAETRKHLAPDSFARAIGIVTTLGARAELIADVVRPHREESQRIATKTAELWRELEAADDVPRRMGLVHAIKLQNQQRAKALLAWQTAIDEEKKRRHLTAGLMEALDELGALSGPRAATGSASGGEAERAPREGAEFREEMRSGIVTFRPPEPDDSSLLPVDVTDAAGDFVADEADITEAPESVPPVSANRRDARRLRLAEPIQIGRDDHHFYTGFTENISGNGIFVATFEPTAAIGDICDLEFEMPDGAPIHTRAQVRWSREWHVDSPDILPGIGLRFLRLSPEDEQRIDAYIAREGSLFFDDE